MKKLIILLLLSVINIQIIYAYELNNSDKIIINSITTKVQEKSDVFQIDFLNKLEQIIYNWNYTERIQVILDSIYNDINDNLNTNEEILISSPDNNITENTDIDINDNEYYLDINQVKNNWLDWNNQTRQELSLNNYSFNQTLESSAKVWSDSALEKWEISHERNQWDWFYNYNEITKWFANNWVECKNIEWITHTENIWWWAYSCNDWECSDELTDAISRAYTSYINEKWTDNDAHYRSLTNQYFKNIWLWISIEETSENYYEYYLTIHYCTELL